MYFNVEGIKDFLLILGLFLGYTVLQAPQYFLGLWAIIQKTFRLKRKTVQGTSKASDITPNQDSANALSEIGN